jgi:hypothetical protein
METYTDVEAHKDLSVVGRKEKPSMVLENNKA